MGGPTGDIGKNVTMVCSAGWDWVPPVRDRNMGIWQPVLLRTSGDVTIVQPQLITDLPNLPDTSVAKLSLNLSLSNHNQNNIKGILQVTIRPENFTGTAVSFFERGKHSHRSSNSGSFECRQHNSISDKKTSFVVAQWLRSSQLVSYPSPDRGEWDTF